MGLDKWGYYQTQVVFPEIGSQIRFSFAATGATQFEFDNVHLGSIVGATGAFISDWEEFTPQFNWTSSQPWKGQYRRVGENVEFKIGNIADITTTSDRLLFTLPDNLTYEFDGSFTYANIDSNCFFNWAGTDLDFLKRLDSAKTVLLC